MVISITCYYTAHYNYTVINSSALCLMALFKPAASADNWKKIVDH